MDDLGEADSLSVTRTRARLMLKSRIVFSSRSIATIARYFTGPTDASRSRIVFGFARSSAIPRADPPISAATASACDPDRPVRIVSRPVAA